MQEISCLFCKIGVGEIATTITYQDDLVVAFPDQQPKAPIHILVIPKKHIKSADDIQPADEKLVGALIFAAQQVAREAGIAENGYRLVFNVRSHADQTVDHLHLHILGGEHLGPMA